MYQGSMLIHFVCIDIFNKLLLIITHEPFFAYMTNELGWWSHGLDGEDVAIPGAKLSAIN